MSKEMKAVIGTSYDNHTVVSNGHTGMKGNTPLLHFTHYTGDPEA